MQHPAAFERPPASSSRQPYFAYGLNMDEIQLAGRCPEALLLGPATLPEHRFIINRRGVATVVPATGAMAYGLLWDLTGKNLEKLDRFEGVPSGHYTRELANVLTQNGAIVRATIYVASDATPGKPRSGYLEQIIMAAREHGFPSHYLEVLEACRMIGGSSS